MLALLLSKGGLAAIAVALVLAVIGVQTLRLAHAKHDLSATATKLQAETATSAGLRASVAASETRRDAEYTKATSAVSAAEAACAARVAAAQRSGAAIHKLMEKPHAVDPATHCPARSMYSAGELRDALQWNP